MPIVGLDPDGETLVYATWARESGRDSGPGALYRAQLDGSGTAWIADLVGFGGGAALSPDGRRVAFTADRGSGRRVYMLDLATGAEWCASCEVSLGDDRTPTFSPDGDQLVFASYSPFSSDLYVVDVDGANPLLLTEGPDVFGYYDSGPIWR